jgi:hypothetical protein
MLGYVHYSANARMRALECQCQDTGIRVPMLGYVHYSAKVNILALEY